MEGDRERKKRGATEHEGTERGQRDQREGERERGERDVETAERKGERNETKWKTDGVDEGREESEMWKWKRAKEIRKTERVGRKDRIRREGRERERNRQKTEKNVEENMGEIQSKSRK